MKRKVEKLLFVTKNQEDSKHLVSKMKNEGYSCFIADTPESAMSFLNNELIRILFIDIIDQVDEKLQLIKEIKERNSGIGIVVITSTISDKNVIKAFSLGANNFIIKPSDWERLPLVVSSTLEHLEMELQTRSYIQNLERQLDTTTITLDHSTDIVEQILVDNIKSFIALLEIRDVNTGRHCKRVATFCTAVSEKYDIKDRVKREIEIGALLHDIGKIGLPDTILSKTTNYFAYQDLSSSERIKYETHPIIGQEAVDMVGMLSNVGLYIKHHHERFDGTGYPDKLEGFYIPLGARIIGVVDAYEKIIFRAVKSKQEEAEKIFINYLRKQQGIIFDPEASEKLIEFLAEFKKKEYSKDKKISIKDVVPGMIIARDVCTIGGMLVISQYEKISENDGERLKQFVDNSMIPEKIFIYESSQIKKPSKKKKNAATATTKTTSVPVSENVYDAIDAVKDFSTLPEIHSFVMKYMIDAKSTKFDFADILKRDPVIVLKILRIANSPFFGGKHDVTSVEKAASLIGYKEIRNIVASLTVLSENNHEDDIFNREDFWKHMVGTAIICRFIAKHIDVKFVDEYFTAGLLHDIGKLVFDQLFPEKFHKVLQLAREESIFYRKAERSVFEYTHEEVGEYILNKWNIPDVIKDAVRNHHSPMDSKVDSILVSTVHLSNIIAHILHIGESGDKVVAKYESFAEQKLGITLTDIDTLLPEIEEEIEKNKELLFIQ